jgi:hypothetical protein
MTAIVMRFGNGVEVRAALREGTPSVAALVKAIPFKSVVHRWGDEVYFDAPFHSVREKDARAEMENGDLAFWPDGDALCVFFGPTPVSTDGKPRAYSPCNTLGRISGPVDKLKSVKGGISVEVLDG